MSKLQDQTVHTGASILLMVKNKIIGRAQGINGDTDFGTEGVYEIGTIMPAEFVHNKYSGSVTIERYYVDKASLVDLGITSLAEDILTQDEIDIVIVSKKDNSVIRAYRGCSTSNYRNDFRANAITGENATFMYLKASDSNN